MKLYPVVAAALAVTVAACDSPGRSPTALRGVDANAASQGVTGSATGGGKAQLPPGFSLLRFSLGVVTDGSGNASGQFSQRYVSSGGSVDFHGAVTCVSFDPVNNRAWVGGVITQNNSTNPATLTPIHQVGREVWFRVVDGGEGEGAVDRTTVYGFEGGGGILTSAEYCQRQLWTAGDANTWAVIEGNIQVRP